MAPRARNILVIYGEDKKKLSNAVCNVFTDLQKYAEQHKVICTQEEISDVTCNIKAAWLKIHKYKVGFVGPVKSPDRLQEMIKLVDQEELCYYLVCCSGEDGKEGTLGQFIKKGYCAYNEEYWYNAGKTDTSDNDTCNKVVDRIKVFCGVFESSISSDEILKLRADVVTYVSKYYSETNGISVDEENAVTAYESFRLSWAEINPYNADNDRDRKIQSLYGVALVIYSQAVGKMPEFDNFESVVQKLNDLVWSYDKERVNRYYLVIKYFLFYNLGICLSKLGEQYDKKAIESFKKYIYYKCCISYHTIYQPEVFSFYPCSKYLFQNLNNEQICLSTPDSFNDPFDCPVLWLLDGSDRVNKLIKQAYLEGLRIKCFVRNLTLPHAADPSDITSDSITKKKRHNCNGSEFQNELMWAHYADSHKGICVKYVIDVSASKLASDFNSVFSAFKDVEYSNKKLEGFRKNIPFNTFESFFVKREAWSYENETRFIYYDINSPKEHQPYEIPNSIEAVYFGIRCSAQDKRKVISCLRGKRLIVNKERFLNGKTEEVKKESDIKFYQMVRSEKKFGELEPKEITTDEIDLLSKEDVTNKYIICDFNEEDAGKSESLLMLIDVLETKGTWVNNNYNHKIHNSGPDRYRCYDVPYKVNNIPTGTIRIAVCTQGDPYSFQKQWLEQATNIDKADIVVCASRVLRETVRNIYDNAGIEYKIIWMSGFCTDDYYDKKTKAYVKNITNGLNSATANSIINAIEQLYQIQL